MNFKERLNNLSLYMDYFIKEKAFAHQAHYRIITDKEIPFPRNYQCVKHDELMEVSPIAWDKHQRKGWSKPDKAFLGVEIRYLWKNHRILSFDEWLKKTKS